MKVILKSIIGYPGYKAGSDGNIYSYKIKNRYDYNKKPKILKSSLDSRKKYLIVGLCKNGKPKTILVHSLICEAFHGKRPKGMTVSHENGNRLDNTPSNLKWRNLKDNHNLKIIHGTDDCGVLNSRALFNKEQLNKIREMIEKSYKLTEIARKFNTTDKKKRALCKVLK